MGWTERDIPDLTGRVAVVTGANGGLGLASTKALAGKGAHVVMAARNQTKAQSAKDEVLAGNATASVEIVELDLGDQASVQTAAATIAADHATIDILLNNAGLMAMPERQTADGYEMQFGVNHLGHWTFTAGLLPNVLAADAGRIVTVTSVARHWPGADVDPDDPHLRKNYSEWGAYGQAKRANFVFAMGLQKRLEAADATSTSLAAHPGLTNSDLQSHTVAEGNTGFIARVSEKWAAATGMSTTDGARSQLRAATDPQAKGGEIYGPRFGSNGPPSKLIQVNNFGLDKAIDTLWAVSERETGVALPI